jgi:hypothetical protein
MANWSFDVDCFIFLKAVQPLKLVAVTNRFN